jgi:hypothetical protein
MQGQNPRTVRITLLASAFLASLAFSPSCREELPTLGEVLAQFEAEIGLLFEVCSGGEVDCGTAPNVSPEFIKAQSCLLDAWMECRPTHFDYVLAQSTDTILLRHVYIFPSQGTCNLELFEHKLPTSAKEDRSVDRRSCKTLISNDVCGGLEFQDCSLVETVRIAAEQWNE